MLQVHVLGKFEIRVDGQLVELPLRAAQSLLAYLLLNAGTPHRREQLAGLIWPETSEAKAKRNLRQTLFRLRQAIGAQYLVADDLTIAFDAAGDYWLDAQVVTHRVAAETSTADLIDAVAAYGGELLPGFYDEWVLFEREQLHVALEHKLTLLLEQLVEARRWDEVLEWGERWITLGHTPEAAYRALIVAYGACGDLSQAVAVFQRCEEALRRDLGVEPSPQTHAALERAQREAVTTSDRLAQRPRTNLPASLSSFIGREKEIAEVRRLITTHRAMTLTGSGGAGKTRLAIESASGLTDHFADGVWLIEFAPLNDVGLLAQTVASTLGLVGTGGRPIVTALVDVLREKQRLLIFDNCEHLIDACAQLAMALLSTCPQLHILFTSRELLGIAGETPFRVPPLSTPGAQQLPIIPELAHYEAVQLFVARGAAAVPTYALTSDNAAAIARICQRLDGMPLAIELAAARLRTLSTEEIAVRLDDRFRLLTGGSRTALPRHQTLHATIEWSYNLLSAAEQVLLQRLSVFAGSWTLEVAENVCGENSPSPLPSPIKGEGVRAPLAPAGRGVAEGPPLFAGAGEVDNVLDLLTRLVDKSLVFVERTPGQETRYRMLDTIRQYARQKLTESGGGEEIHDRLLDYYLQVVKQAEPEFFGPKELLWLVWLENEWDNIRAAMEWSLEKRPEAVLEIVNCLGYFYLDIGHHVNDIGSWLSQLMPHAANSARTAVRAWGLLLWAWCATFETTRTSPGPLLTEGLSICEELGDKNGLAHFYFLQSGFSDDPQTNLAHSQQALTLFRETNDKPWIANTLLHMGWDLTSLDPARRLACLEESLALYRELGYVSGIIEALKQLGALEARLGHFESAHRWLDEGSSILQSHASSLRASKTMSYDLGDLAFYEGHNELALHYYEDSLGWADQRGLPIAVGWARARLGFVLARHGERQKARQNLCEALLLFKRATNQSGVILTLEGHASLAVVECSWEKASTLFAYATNQREVMLALRLPVEEALVERDLAFIRAQLDDSTFHTAQAAGRAMTQDEAIAYALSEEVVN